MPFIAIPLVVVLGVVLFVLYLFWNQTINLIFLLRKGLTLFVSILAIKKIFCLWITMFWLLKNFHKLFKI